MYMIEREPSLTSVRQCREPSEDWMIIKEESDPNSAVSGHI